MPFIDANGKVSLFDETHVVNQYNAYVQDEWKVRSNLTLSYGLRWEYNPPGHTRDGKTFVANTPILDGPTTFVPAKGWYKNEKYGVFGPSLGLVWGPEFKQSFLKTVFGEAGKSSIRLGYRLADDPISSFQITAAAGRVPGLLVTCSSVIGGTTSLGCSQAPDLTIGNGFPNQLPPPSLRPSAFFTLPTQLNSTAPPVTVFAPKLKTPLVHEWSLSWQRELPWQLVMQAAYVGRRGTHLYFAGNRNQINPDAILPSFLQLQENMRRGCLPAGTGPLVTGGTCTNPITNIPLIAPGTGITAANVNATAQINQISPGVTVTGSNGSQTFPVQNAAGAFAERIENLSLFFHLRPNQQFGAITYIDNSGDSTYQAAQFTLRRRFANGLGLAAAYTFGKSIDNQSVDPVGAASGGGLSTTNSRTPSDTRNLREERARSDFDRTHVFNLSTIWELPVGRGKWLGRDTPRWLNQIIGGWTVNGISTYMTGEPFSVRSGSRTSNSGHESRADVIDPSIRAQLQNVNGIIGPVLFANANGFAVPAPGKNGAGRNIFVASGYYNLDIGFIKQFSISERFKLDFRTEMFNILNHTNYDNPRDASSGSPNIQSPVFAQTCCAAVAPPSTQTIIQTGESSRVIQFALKLKF